MKIYLPILLALTACTKTETVYIDNYCTIATQEKLIENEMIVEPYRGRSADTSTTKDYLDKRLLVMCELECFDGELGEKCKALLEAN